MMDFIEIGIVDVIDIFVVALIMYQIYRLTRGTNAISIIFGVILLYLLWVVVQAMNMELLSTILGQIIGVGVIALIVVFQQEIRRFLILLGSRYSRGKGSMFSRMLNTKKYKNRRLGWIDSMVAACEKMASENTGALIVIMRHVQLTPIIESGVIIDANISDPLLRNIFFKNAPLHDGAVVIVDDRIKAAKCILPSTEKQRTFNFGTRHMAALGVTEISDAVVVVVSEERGIMSIAQKGHIRQDVTPAQLKTALVKALM